MIANGHEQAGHDLATAVSAILTIAMGRRYIVCILVEHFLALSNMQVLSSLCSRAAQSRKFMPSGAVSAIAVVAGLYNGKKSYEWRNGVSF